MISSVQSRDRRTRRTLIAQQEIAKRSVALKVVNAGQVSPGLLHRFEHETAVLERLQHLDFRWEPAIADDVFVPQVTEVE